ncbi:MAG: protein kinase domain-containing protein, partial [Acidimicrobiales bacterium]
MAGRRLGDRYELVKRVGTGGMAEVWEAVDTSLGRNVAIKLLHRHLAEDPAVLTRFRTEAQAAARLTHPGIVAIYDTVSDEDGTDAIVMELVDGQDLRTILDARRSLAVNDVIEVAMQLANALAQAHESGIVHRDIKPANVLVRPDRRVKLSDFGIAKALGSTTHTETGSVVGTMKYLAPEQIDGSPVDGRTDLYALTTVMFEMLCGQVPFDAQDLAAAMSRVSRDAPRARSVRPDLSPALDEFLARGLARDPNDRPADATTFAAELAAVR